MPYNVEINDTILLIYVITNSLFLLLSIGVGVFAFCFFNDKENSKNTKRMKALREKAATDPVAEKRLKKMERKRKRNLKNRVDEIIAFALIFVVIFVELFIGVIPVWSDYIKKDYVVYEGDIYVQRWARSSSMDLEDGTVLTGSLGLEEGHHNNKRIVYSKRSEIALCMEK